MRRLLFAAIVFTFLISSAAFPQDKLSVQFNGGIIYPFNSSNGLFGTVQLNYIADPMFQLYIYSGHSVWDKYFVEYKGLMSSTYNKTHYETYTEDDHVLIPVYAGCRINLHTNKIFTSFLSVEAGYAYYSYNSYTPLIITDDTGAIISYTADMNSKKEHNEDLYAIGLGAGLSHPMSDNINLLLLFKLNTFNNSNYTGFFSAKGTYTSFQIGVNFLI